MDLFSKSFGPIYAPFADPSGAAAGGGMGGYFARAKKGDIALIPMIESAEGLANVEEILAMEHVTGCLIGPADLRLSLGMSVAIDGSERDFREAMGKIVGTAKKCGKVVGTVALGEEAIRKRVEEGVDFLFTTFDFGALVSGLKSDLDMSRKAVEGVVQK